MAGRVEASLIKSGFGLLSYLGRTVSIPTPKIVPLVDESAANSRRQVRLPDKQNHAKFLAGL